MNPLEHSKHSVDIDIRQQAASGLERSISKLNKKVEAIQGQIEGLDFRVSNSFGIIKFFVSIHASVQKKILGSRLIRIGNLLAKEQKKLEAGLAKLGIKGSVSLGIVPLVPKTLDGLETALNGMDLQITKCKEMRKAIQEKLDIAAENPLCISGNLKESVEKSGLGTSLGDVTEAERRALLEVDELEFIAHGLKLQEKQLKEQFEELVTTSLTVCKTVKLDEKKSFVDLVRMQATLSKISELYTNESGDIANKISYIAKRLAISKPAKKWRDFAQKKAEVTTSINSLTEVIAKVSFADATSQLLEKIQTIKKEELTPLEKEQYKLCADILSKKLKEKISATVVPKKIVRKDLREGYFDKITEGDTTVAALVAKWTALFPNFVEVEKTFARSVKRDIMIDGTTLHGIYTDSEENRRYLDRGEDSQLIHIFLFFEALEKKLEKQFPDSTYEKRQAIIQKVLSQCTIERDPAGMAGTDYLEIRSKLLDIGIEMPMYTHPTIVRKIRIDTSGLTLTSSMLYKIAESDGTVTLTSTVKMTLDAKEPSVTLEILPD